MKSRVPTDALNDSANKGDAEQDDPNIIPVWIGWSDRFATILGIPLAVAVLMYSHVVMAWGVYNIFRGWGANGEWDWEGVGLFTFGSFKLAFGFIGAFGVVTKSVTLLYLTMVCFKVFVLCIGVEVVINWIQYILVREGTEASSHSWKDLLIMTGVALFIVLGGLAFFYGMFKSLSAVVVVGGSGFERLNWAQIMLQRTEYAWVLEGQGSEGGRKSRGAAVKKISEPS